MMLVRYYPPIDAIHVSNLKPSQKEYPYVDLVIRAPPIGSNGFLVMDPQWLLLHCKWGNGAWRLELHLMVSNNGLDLCK